MPNKMQCARHGECFEAFVCAHLVGDQAGLGFNRGDPTSEDPFPDAWCDDCEIIRAANNGWTEETEKLLKLAMMCSGCYERARIRNTRPTVTLDDLAGLRWKCATCEEWHTGPCLDFSYAKPAYWNEDHEKESRKSELLPNWFKKRPRSFLNTDYCAIHDEDFFVRGNIYLPIIGTGQNFCWGVWGSLSRDDFETLLKMEEDPKRVELPPLFSWLSSQIPQYPDTLNLKMNAHIKEPGLRPHFELEYTDHPLSQEYHKGITPQRVKEIMMQLLRGTEQNA